MADEAITVEPGRSMVHSWYDAFDQHSVKNPDGLPRPVLRVEVRNSVWEFEWQFQGAERQQWESNNTILLQIDSDMVLRMVEPRDLRPVPKEYEQPPKWPLIPVERLQ